MGMDYRDLRAWQSAMELAEATYRATGALPSEERFGLTAQMRRASVSVPSNIAEGNARPTRGEYLHFLGIARGSLAELETQTLLSERLGWTGLGALHPLIRQTQRQLQALINSLRK
jgi:four helix bundle protein